MPPFDPERILRVLGRYEVDYVLVGGVAATLHGSPIRTSDLDICPSRDRANLEHLSKALVALNARIRSLDAPRGIRFAADWKFLAQMELLNLTTRFGDLDLVFVPPGTRGFEDLRAGAVTYDVDGLRVRTASIEDLIRSKRAAGRPKDFEQLSLLRDLRRAAERRGPRRPRRSERS